MFSNISYQSVKLVRVQDARLAFTYYAIVLAVLAYVIIYTIILEKGYQEHDTLVGSTMVKAKGSTFYSGTPSFLESSSQPVSTRNIVNTEFLAADDLNNTVVLDAIDLVLPPFTPNELFVATGGVFTPSQTRQICSGSDAGTEACNCTTGKTPEECCRAGDLTMNGRKTGKCSNGLFCDIYAWCPLEKDNFVAFDESIGNWTIYIRVDVHFPKFDVRVSNLDANAPKPVLGESLFTINDLLNKSGYTYAQIKQKGAILGILFEYDCDLNHAVKDCKPKLSVTRLDHNVSRVATGFNYRLATKYHLYNLEFRDVQKVNGIRMIIQVTGTAGKFSLPALSVTLGAGLALLGISTVICDILMQYCLPKSKVYSRHKYEQIYGDDGD